MSEIWFRAGEATVLAAEGQYRCDAGGAHRLGPWPGGAGLRVDDGSAQAIPQCTWCATSTSSSARVTMMTSKVTIQSADYVELLGGVVQAATGDAIVDCIIEGILPRRASKTCA